MRISDWSSDVCSSDLINPDVLSHSTEAAELQEELNSQLAAINKAIPPASLTVLKQSPIWVEWEKRRDKAAEFHVSEIWLAANGYNPDKIGDRKSTRLNSSH